MITTRKYTVQPKQKTDQKWEVLGFDTETFNGKVTLIANSDKEYKKINQCETLIKFLLKKKFRKTINFFFNLEYDANAIIKWFPKKNIKELIYYNETILKLNNNLLIKIVNIPKKCLKLSYVKPEIEKGKIKIHHTVKFFDIMNFYQIGSLVKTYKKVFPNKEYIKSMDAEKGFKYEEIDEKVINYCIEDAITCFELADNFVSMTNQFITLRDYYSPASIGKGLVKKYLEKPYIFQKNHIQAYALKSYSGGRFEVIKRGFFENLYMYDINSAYPYIISEMKKPNGYELSNKEYMEKSIYSFFYVNVKMPELKITPLKFLHEKENILIFPNGKMSNLFLTKTEYENILKYDIRHEIISARHLIGDTIEYPFKWVKDIYNLRQKFKNQNPPDPREHILKLALNSIYGSFIQTTKKYSKVLPNKVNEIEENMLDVLDDFIYCKDCGYELLDEKGVFKKCPDCGNDLSLLFRKKEYIAGGLYNPVYATTITADTRIKIFEDSIKNNSIDNIVMYATDSITFDKKINHLSISNKLGEYDKKDNFYGLIIGSGLYSFKDKNGNIKLNKQKFRGFGEMDIMDIAQKNKNKNVYTYIKRQTPYKLKESKNDLERINIFHDKDRDLELNFDKKRIWEYEAKTFRDLLENQIDSMPITL